MKIKKRSFLLIIGKILIFLLSLVLSTVKSLNSSAYLDIYTQKGGQGLNQNGGIFVFGEIVYIYAHVAYQGVSVPDKLVGFEVQNAQNISFFERSAITNESGIAVIFFRIPWNESCENMVGYWTVISTVSVSEQTVNDTLSFEVKGMFFDLYTQRNGKGPSEPSDAFAPQEEVFLYGYVKYNCNPIADKIVSFEVIDANGTAVDYRTALTNASGIAFTTFRIPSTPAFGEWKVFAAVEVLGFIANDTVTFKVGWIIELLDIQITDDYGIPKTFFMRGERMNFLLTLKNIAFTSRVVTLTVNVYDCIFYPIGEVTLQKWVIPSSISSSFVFGIEIPNWACVGIGSAYADAFTIFPYLNGTAYCPEIYKQFQIVKS